MTYYGPKEMAASFRTVRGNTIKIAEEIPEESYGFRAAPECRSVAETLVHIAVGPRFQEQIHLVERSHTLMGFDFFGFMGKQVAEEQSQPHADGLRLLRLHGQAGGRGAGDTVEGRDFGIAARGRRKVRPGPGWPLRGVPGGERPVGAGDGAAQQVAFRDAARPQGARDAPSRPAHAGTAHARQGAALDASNAGEGGRHEGSRANDGIGGVRSPPTEWCWRLRCPDRPE